MCNEQLTQWEILAHLRIKDFYQCVECAKLFDITYTIESGIFRRLSINPFSEYCLLCGWFSLPDILLNGSITIEEIENVYGNIYEIKRIPVSPYYKFFKKS